MARAKASDTTAKPLKTDAQRRWMFGGQNRNKYNAKKTVVDGYTCDSKMEASRFQELLDARANGDIAEVVFHPRVMLDLTKYEADFLVVDSQWGWHDGSDGRPPPGAHKHWYEDVKGQETARFREIRKYWKKYGHLPLRILKRQGKNNWKSEWIIPDSMEPSE